MFINSPSCQSRCIVDDIVFKVKKVIIPEIASFGHSYNASAVEKADTSNTNASPVPPENIINVL